MATNNPADNYPDFIIKDISSSAQQYNVDTVPVVFTLDGPLSLKGTGQPYTLTVSKIKDR